LGQIIEVIRKEADKVDKVLLDVKRLSAITDKEELRKEMELIPDDYKDHPAICRIRNTNFVKEKSSGKDLVIFCGTTEDVWNPRTAREQGIGGSEEAVVHLSEGLVKLGWNVTVYNNCGYKEEVFDGVTYKPHWAWNYRDKQDAVILWRSPRLADYEINTDKLYVDLHDVVQEGEFNEKRLAKIDKIFVKSNFHRALFPNVPDDKFVVIPNGIDASAFFESEKDPNLIINTSSPDRSLSALIDVFEMVKKEVPSAKLQWAYGFKVFDAVHGSNDKIMEWKKRMMKRMEEVGIEVMGRVSHEKVAQMYRKANIFLYPTEFAEIHCISAAKAQAGGAIPVCTDFAALEETVQFGFKAHSEKNKDNWCQPYQFDFGAESKEAKRQMADEVIRLLKNPPKDRSKMSDWAKDTYDWSKIIEQWNQILTQS
jgi:glycosyltransferase involved in cell wall biosynthesis